jgi:hypothetical protein
VQSHAMPGQTKQLQYLNRKRDESEENVEL